MNVNTPGSLRREIIFSLKRTLQNRADTAAFKARRLYVWFKDGTGRKKKNRDSTSIMDQRRQQQGRSGASRSPPPPLFYPRPLRTLLHGVVGRGRHGRWSECRRRRPTYLIFRGGRKEGRKRKTGGEFHYFGHLIRRVIWRRSSACVLAPRRRLPRARAINLNGD